MIAAAFVLIGGALEPVEKIVYQPKACISLNSPSQVTSDYAESFPTARPLERHR
jgi:hypothetical protein